MSCGGLLNCASRPAKGGVDEPSSSQGESGGEMKAIRTILPSPGKHWVGDGFNVYPVFSDLAFTNEISPFLMFDYAAPKHFPATSKQLGVGRHPHRGFETITIAFQGEVEHRDSVGNQDVIGEGDVQWMTAGRGIIHEEYHSQKFAKKGGTFEMCQLWLNLPKAHKMDPPGYQPILNKNIPQVPLEGCQENGMVRVVAGEHHGVRGPARTHSPVNLWDIIMSPRSIGKRIALRVPRGHNTILFVRKGGVVVGDDSAGSRSKRTMGPQQVAVMGQAGELLLLEATTQDTQLMLLGGEPLDEPIAARGPFVMNTEKELQQANADYRSGNLGR